MNNITKRVLLGVSVMIGYAVARTTYKVTANSINERMLINDAEIIFEEEIRE